MKKNIKFILAVVSIAFLFTSCNKVEEDYYFPKERLSSIKSTDYSAVFKYDKKKITQIVMDDETLTLQYDKNKQISEIDYSLDNEKVLITYNDDKKISECSYYKGSDLIYYEEFVRNGDHIASVRTYGSSDDWKKTCQSKLFKLCFDSQIVSLMTKNAAKTDLTLTSETFWTYTGDNLTLKTTSATYAGITATLRSTYTYDTKNNPYYGLPYPLMQFMAYSFNNPVSVNSAFVLGNTTTTTDAQYFSYTYDDKDYPVTATISATQGGDIEQIVTYTYEQ